VFSSVFFFGRKRINVSLQNVPFHLEVDSFLLVVCMITVILSHRDRVSAGTFRDSCRVQGHGEREMMYIDMSVCIAWLWLL